MHKKITISLEENVYDGLIRLIGRNNISQFLEDLARPQVLQEDLALSYQTMAEDQSREEEALEWAETLLNDINHASR